MWRKRNRASGSAASAAALGVIKNETNVPRAIWRRGPRLLQSAATQPGRETNVRFRPALGLFRLGVLVLVH